jgi:hypothetical protein
LTLGVAVALVLTIALGIGSNAAVHAIVRGFLTRDMPLPNRDAVGSIFSADEEGGNALVSYHDYVSIREYGAVFEWVDAARSHQAADCTLPVANFALRAEAGNGTRARQG